MSEAEELQQHLEELASQYSLLSAKIANLKETCTRETDEASRRNLGQQIEGAENSRTAIEEEFYKKGRQFVYLGYPNALEALMDKMTTHDTPSPRFSLLYGDIAYIKGEWDKASDCYKQVFSSPKANEKDQVDGRSEYGKMLLRKGETQTALSHFEKSYEICKHISYRKGEAQSLRYIGLVYRTLGDLTSAKNKLNEALQIYQELDEQDEVASLISDIGGIFWIKNDLNEALEKYNKSLRISEKTGNKKNIAWFLEYIGYARRAKGDLEQSLEKYETSLKIREEIGDKLGITRSLNRIGHLLYHKGRDEINKDCEKQFKTHPNFLKKMDALIQKNSVLKEAIEKHQKSLEISHEIEYKLGIAAALNYIGNILAYVGNSKNVLESHEKALEKFNESLKIREEIGDMPGVAKSLNSLESMIHFPPGDWDYALEKYTKCLKILEGIGDKVEIAKCYSNLGRVYGCKNDPLLSLQNLFTSKAINNQIGIKDQCVTRRIFSKRKYLGFKRFKTIAKEAFEQLPEDLKPYLNIDEFTKDTTVRHDTPKVDRNDPCPCGSGKKYKKCCGR